MLQQTLENFAIFSFFFFLYFLIRFAWNWLSLGFSKGDESKIDSVNTQANGYKKMKWEAHTGEIDLKSKKWNSVDDINNHHGLAK